jgi:hypothetical protein
MLYYWPVNYYSTAGACLSHKLETEHLDRAVRTIQVVLEHGTYSEVFLRAGSLCATMAED